MPKKGKRSRAATLRWQRYRLDLADPQISPSTVTQQTAQPETAPPAQSFWTKKDATTPSQSPAQKMAKLQIPLPATSSCSHSKAEQMAKLQIPLPATSSCSHSKAEQLTCEQCGQLFYTEMQLERHQRLHCNDGQPLPRGATSSSSTPHHVGSHKVGPQRKGFIPCSVGGRTFTTASGLSIISDGRAAVVLMLMLMLLMLMLLMLLILGQRERPLL
ncbi:hypothetical protein CRUP_025150 [Coryphaenoides rupestris]|nr:hypothetical protein CRUP_025150 [Coryphaenoides rupestris]